MSSPVIADLDGIADLELPRIKFANGAVVIVQRLRTRQFFRLLKIITRGAGQYLMQSRLSLADDPDEFIAKLLGVLVVAFPEAEQETIDFMFSMVEPDGLIQRTTLSKPDQERNAELWRQVTAALDNPELEDTFSLLETVVRQEAADIQALGKRLNAMMQMATKTGQLDPVVLTPSSNGSAASTPSSDDSTPTSSSEDSPPPST